MTMSLFLACLYRRIEYACVHVPTYSDPNSAHTLPLNDIRVIVPCDDESKDASGVEAANDLLYTDDVSVRTSKKIIVSELGVAINMALEHNAALAMAAALKKAN